MSHPSAEMAYEAAQEQDDLAAEREILNALPDNALPRAKRKKSTSPTQRTLAELRKRKMSAQVVERWNPHAKVRVDLFGVIDLLAIDSNTGNVLGRASILAIQACAGASHAARRDKILAEPRARQWVEAGGRLELWSWSLRGAAGKAKRWTLRVETYAEMVAAASEGA